MISRIVNELKKGPQTMDVLLINTATFTGTSEFMHTYNVAGFCGQLEKHGLVTRVTENNVATYTLTQKGLDAFVDCDSCGRPWHEEGANLEPTVTPHGPMVLCAECI